MNAATIIAPEPLRGFFWAVRKSDHVRTIVWTYVDARGRQRVGCPRTCRPVELADFEILARVVWPFAAPLDF